MKMTSDKVLLLTLLSLSHFVFVEGSSESGSTDPTVVILFMFLGLALGVITTQILSYFNNVIPYTVVIFILGICISFFSKTEDDGIWGQSIQEWSKINAELMLFVFLPPLIFGEAMGLNWFHVIGGFFQALLLAGPGVVIGAFAMGALTKVILPYNWSWELCLTFGSILSATDPVAVVALLKEAGASPKLTILIVGESLMNDGTAIVMFTLFFNMLKGEVYTAGDIIVYFFEAALGSSLFGIACGFVVVRWLRSANRPLKEVDITIQIAVTLVSAYLIFFTAQGPFEVSGVLACCGAGVMVAWLAPPIILSHETMHNVWGMIEWIGNTLIFLLTGLIIGIRTLGQVSRLDWLYVVILYVILMALRAIIVAMFYPFLANMGHKCTKREAVFITWAGLRGALGMALALIVEKSKGLKDSSVETSRLFFYIGGIAALTLIFNATLANFVLDKLGLVGDESAQQTLIMTQIRKRLRKKMNKMIDELQLELDPQGIDEVRGSCSLLHQSDLEGLFENSILNRNSYSHSYLHPTIPESREEATGDEVLIDAFGPARDREVSVDVRNLDKYRPPSISVLNGIGTGDSMRSTSGGSDMSTGSTGGNRTTGSRQKSGGSGQTANTANRQKGLSFSSILTGQSKLEEARSRAQSMAAMMTREGHDSRHDSKYLLGEGGVVPELVAYVRTVFLEIVRVSYWKHIEEGKLPRLSHSAQFLLFSIDVGLDDVTSENALNDWTCIEKDLDSTPLYIKVLVFLERVTPLWCTSISSLLGRLEARREKRAVYMLTSFIEAHEQAQKKVHSFLGVDEDDLEYRSPEELKVTGESQYAVAQAKERMRDFSVDTVADIRTKQAARRLLAKQAEMVRSMMQDGLLTAKHAEEFLEEISEDTQNIEKERNRMYRMHANSSAKRREASKLDFTTIRSVFGETSYSSSTPIRNSFRRSETAALAASSAAVFGGSDLVEAEEVDSPLMGSAGVLKSSSSAII